MKNKLRIITAAVVILLSVLTTVFIANAGDTYKITYDLGVADSSPSPVVNPNPKEYNSNVTVILEEPSCTGFDFMGWYIDAEYTVPVKKISENSEGDITVYAKWYESTYNIIYILNGGDTDITANDIVNPNTTARRFGEAVYLEDPVASDDVYTFAGWYTDPEYKNKTDRIEEYTGSDIALYALWKNTGYHINYDLGEATASSYDVTNPNPEYYEYSKELTLLSLSTKDPGLKFDGWYFDSYFTEKAESIPAGTKGELTVYAKWTVKTYPLIYVLDDGSGIDTETVTNPNPSSWDARTDLHLSDAVTTDRSRAFEGWYSSPYRTEDTRIDLIPANIHIGITLYAKWKTAVYDIVYDLGIIDPILCPVENNNPTSYKYGETFVLSDIETDGFIFNGWSLNKDLSSHVTDLPEGSYGKVTLYADLTEKTYTVKYVLESGGLTEKEIGNSKNATIRTTTERIVFADPTTVNPLYSFEGWYKDPELTQKTDRVPAYTVGNITVYAKWVKIVSYLPVWGDATLSDQLSVADARLALRYAAKLETFNDLQLRVADIDNDGKVTPTDARLILRLAAKLEDIEKLKQKYDLPTIDVVDGEIVFIQ